MGLVKATGPSTQMTKAMQAERSKKQSREIRDCLKQALPNISFAASAVCADCYIWPFLYFATTFCIRSLGFRRSLIEES